VVDYIQLPYIIARRRCAIPRSQPGDSRAAEAEAAARADVISKENDVQVRMYFNLSWLQVESPTVAKKYDALVQKARELSHEYRRQAWEAWKRPHEYRRQAWEAWKRPAPGDPIERVLSEEFSYGGLDLFWKNCIIEMRKALYPKWRLWKHWKAGRRVSVQGFVAPFSTLPSKTSGGSSEGN
jgi:hypothetical protein